VVSRQSTLLNLDVVLVDVVYVLILQLVIVLYIVIIRLRVQNKPFKWTAPNLKDMFTQETREAISREHLLHYTIINPHNKTKPANIKT
jgi:hypothetical protein